ncbi:MAG: c-type cytochrome [Acidobacteria bacterium]|nr:c-type cytochrome [Acidobacteriota bacterium]
MRRRRGARRLVLVSVLAAAGALAAAPGTARAQTEHAGQYSQADINFGMSLYGDNCVSCHGPGGDGVDGVNFRSGQFRAASSDRGLMEIISNGIPDTAMLAGDYSQAELTGLVAYLRMMGSLDPSDVTVGDAANGAALYRGKGNCASCHRIGGDGSRTGPDLTDIATIRTAGALAGSLIDPTEAMIPINRTIRAVTRAGTEYVGRRLNEDTYTVQIIDESEQLVSLVKDDLRTYEILTESSMPSYADSLTEQERADILAFLLTLKGVS